MKQTERDTTREEAASATHVDAARRDPHYEEHGYTAEDDQGVGEGEEGFEAEGYPGHNPLRGESAREREHREAVTWTWPRVDAELEEEQRGDRADARICREIGRRVERAATRPLALAVRVLDGAVELEGTVPTRADEQEIEGMARTVQGVTRLDSRLVAADARQEERERSER